MDANGAVKIPLCTEPEFAGRRSAVEVGEASAGAGGGASGDAEGASYGQYVYASFPVDVIVHFSTRPSAFRFSCLPASRVECLLQLPSLQIVFSSKRASDESVPLLSCTVLVILLGSSSDGCQLLFMKKNTLKALYFVTLAITK